MTSVSCCDAGGSRAESISGEPICNDVDVDFVDELPKVDKVFKKTHKRDESRISKISRLSIKSLKGLDGVDGASDVGDKPILPFPGRVVRSLVLSDPETINAAYDLNLLYARVWLAAQTLRPQFVSRCLVANSHRDHVYYDLCANSPLQGVTLKVRSRKVLMQNVRLTQKV